MPLKTPALANFVHQNNHSARQRENRQDGKLPERQIFVIYNLKLSIKTVTKFCFSSCNRKHPIYTLHLSLVTHSFPFRFKN